MSFFDPLTGFLIQAAAIGIAMGLAEYLTREAQQ